MLFKFFNTQRIKNIIYDFYILNTKLLFFIFFVFLIFFISIFQVYSIQSDEIFDVSISQIKQNEDYQFSVDLNFENRIEKNLNFEIEIYSDLENILVASDVFSTNKHITKTYKLSRTFFSNYSIYVNLFYNNNLYQKELKFNLADEIGDGFDIFIENDYYLKNNKVEIIGFLDSENEDKKYFYEFQIYSENKPSIKKFYDLECTGDCSFNFNLNNDIFIDKYNIDVFSLNGILKKSFQIKNSLKTNIGKENYVIDNNKNEIDENLIKGSDLDNNLNPNFNDNSNQDFNGNLSDNLTLIENNLKNKIETILNSSINSEIPKIKHVESKIDIQNLSLDSRENKNYLFNIEETKIDGSVKKKLVTSFSLDDYKPDIDSVSIRRIENENIRINIEKEINSIKIEDIEKNKNNLEKLNTKNNSSKYDFNLTSNSIDPGIYKSSNFFRSDELYALGLISINTEKPLYSLNELVKINFVVLDSSGYLYDRANITLNILKPDGKYVILSTEDKTILATNNIGIYETYFNPDLIGNYKLISQTKIDNFHVNYETDFNVVSNFNFDILRDVPLTIDPWQGTFINIFSIINRNKIIDSNLNSPNLNNSNLDDSNLNSSNINDLNLDDSNLGFKFDFIEKIPAEFYLYDTNADVIDLQDDAIYLKWFDIDFDFNPYYRANSPLITPYIYYLGNSKIEYEINETKYEFYENKSFVMAIDPLLVDTNSNTCSETFGFNCGDWPSSSEGDNTFDTCPSSIGGAADENVVEAIVNQTSSIVSNLVEVTCTFDPYSTGSEEYIYYFNGNIWTQIYSGNPTDGNIHSISRNVLITGNPGTHYFRCIIDWDGENDECANAGSYYDNDDVSIKILNPFLNVLSPLNQSYPISAIDTEFSTSVNSNISYKINSRPSILACSNCNYFNNKEFYNLGQNRIEVNAIDINTGEINTWVEFFEVLSSQINPDVNYSQRSCSETFGFNCGDWPSSSEGDNTFDACPSSIGGAADENVIEVLINQSSAYLNDSVEVTCIFDPYDAGSDEYIYYFNDDVWTQIYSGNPIDGNIHNISRNVLLNGNVGTQYFRCIIDWDGENDECANVGSYYDNDDVSIEVYEFIENIPFLLIIDSPLNINYTTNEIQIDFSSTLNTNFEYNFDSEGFVLACSNCSSYTTNLNIRSGNHELILRAKNPNTNIYEYQSVLFTTTSPINPDVNFSQRSCSETFGFNCGDWPSTSEGDNTFDACPSSIGGAGDENVVEVLINQSSAYLNDSIEVTCIFDPYSTGSEEYIYYFNNNVWSQIYSGNPIDGNIHNISRNVLLNGNTGTQYFRCIIDWDGENDECANQGSYYDNDDVSLEVYEKIIFEYEFYVYSPVNSSTYYSSNIFVDLFANKNSNIDYKLNLGSWNNICLNCNNSNFNLAVNLGNNLLEFRSEDIDTSQILFRNISFNYEIFQDIVASKFNGITTNFSAISNLSNVCNLKLEIISFGKIEYNECIDANNADLDSNINIENNFIEVKSSVIPNYNKSANITFYNVNLVEPIVLKDGNVCSSCIILNNDGVNVSVFVDSFSNYTLIELSSTFPQVLNINPVSSSQFYLNNNISINTTVISNSAISKVEAFIYWQNGFDVIELFDLGGNVYGNIFNNTQEFGIYNITIVANNSLGNVNDSQKSYFEIISNSQFIDTYVSDNNPNVNYATQTDLRIDSIGDIRRIFIQFNLDYLPSSGIEITSALMNLYLFVNGNNMNESVYAVSESWNNTISWNTQPSILPQIWASQVLTTRNQWYSWNLTNLVRNWHNGSIQNNGIGLWEYTEVTNNVPRFRSSESGVNIPELIVTYRDIEKPKLVDFYLDNSSYLIGDNVVITAIVTDNIAVDKVFANISTPSGFNLVELNLISPFTYKGIFNNVNSGGAYIFSIIANDTSNNVLDEGNIMFSIGNLGLKFFNSLKRLDDNIFEITLRLFNLQDFQTQINENLIIYTFIPNSVNLNSSFLFENNLRYTTLQDNISLNNVFSNNGTLYKFNVTNFGLGTGILGSFEGLRNSSNSWFTKFNITSNFSKVDFNDIYISGFYQE